MRFVLPLVNLVFPYRWIPSILLLFLLDLATWMSFHKSSAPQVIVLQDKVLHVLAFFVLFCLGHISFHFDFRPRFHRLALLLLNSGIWLAYGVFIEMVQKHLSYRTASFGDLIADVIGIAAGAIFVTVLKLYPAGSTHGQKR